MEHKRKPPVARSANPAAYRSGRTERLIVPLDGSRLALTALPVAREFAKLTRSTIHLIDITEPKLPAQEALRKLGLRVHQVRNAVVHQTSGDAAGEILRCARELDAACIVMCMYTGREKPAGGLGEVVRTVLCNAACPVVLVPPTRGHRRLILHQLLVPYDGTPTTAAALRPAIEIARCARAHLLILHVVGAGSPAALEPGSLTVPLYIDQIQHDWPAWCDEFVRRALTSRRTERTLKIRLAVAVGEPEIEVVRWARDQDADLIVLAWRGNIEAGRAAVIRAAVREAPCPLLLYRVN